MGAPNPWKGLRLHRRSPWSDGFSGIVALLGATGDTFEQNSMHGNTGLDARDLNPLGSKVWINSDCENDSPAGTISSACSLLPDYPKAQRVGRNDSSVPKANAIVGMTS